MYMCLSACICRLLKNTSELSKTDSKKITEHIGLLKTESCHRNCFMVVLFLVFCNLIHACAHTQKQKNALTEVASRRSVNKVRSALEELGLNSNHNNKVNGVIPVH